MNTSKKQLRLLLARVQRLQEEERSRLARTIHDDLSQKLTALTIELSLLQKRLGRHAEAKTVNETLQLTTAISSAVKRTINDLRPGILDQFGIIAALKSECQRLSQKHGRPVTFSSNADDATMSTEAAGELFRAVQETIACALAAGCSAMAVEVESKPKILTVTVSDNRAAKGINREVLAFLAIEERLRRLNGKAKSTKSKGVTRVSLQLPVQTTKTRADAAPRSGRYQRSS